MRQSRPKNDGRGRDVGGGSWVKSVFTHFDNLKSVLGFQKRCQIDQEHILHQIRQSPKVSETSPIYSPPLILAYVKIQLAKYWITINHHFLWNWVPNILGGS